MSFEIRPSDTLVVTEPDGTRRRYLVTDVQPDGDDRTTLDLLADPENPE